MKRLNDSSDVPEARLGILPKTNISSEKKTRLHSTFPRRNGYSRASTKEPEERELVVDSGASVHMVSKKDLNSAEWETMRISKNPTTVITANGEVQTREEATIYVKELDLFVPVMLLEETPAVLLLEKLCEDHGYPYHLDQRSKTTLTKNGKRIDCNISNCLSFVVLGLSTSSSTSSSPASSTSSPQDSVITTEIPSTERSDFVSEESRGKTSRGSAETENQKKMKITKHYEVNFCKMCPNGQRISKRIWWIRMFNRINTLPVLLMNCQWSREQKWYRARVSTVSIPTFRKTEIVTSA